MGSWLNSGHARGGRRPPGYSVPLFMMKGDGSIALECTYLGGVWAQPPLALIKLGALTWHANVYDIYVVSPYDYVPVNV